MNVRLDSCCRQNVPKAKALFRLLAALGIFLFLVTGHNFVYPQDNAKPKDDTKSQEKNLTTQKDSKKEDSKKENTALKKESQQQDDFVTQTEAGHPEFPATDTVSFIKSLMALCFVLGLIFLGAFFLKKMTGVKGRVFKGSQVPINLISNRTLGEKRLLTIVEIQGKHYFLGVTQDSINMLAELNLEIPEAPLEENSQSFDTILRKARVLLNRSK